MTSLLIALSAALVSASLEEGALYTYRGAFEAVKSDTKTERKSLELRLLVGSTSDGATRVLWQLSEQGVAATSWTERLGEIEWNRDAQAIRGQSPNFEFRHPLGESQIPIFPPLAHFKQRLADGASWTDEKIEFSVSPGEAVEERATWLVEARSQLGRRRAMQVDRETFEILQMRENVFVGQGWEHVLKLQLEKTDSLSADQVAASVEAFHAWQAAKEAYLKIRAEKTARSPMLANDDLEKRLPELKRKSADNFFEPFAASVAKQLRSGDEQLAALQGFRAKAVGKPLADFKLKDSSGREWTNESLADSVTVLHFWSYRDENLREPYGQVGYLDFLARKLAEKKVKVVGVAVFPETREAFVSQKSAVRKFREFMNVSYPVLLDDESLLKSLGDPRTGGQELPLFVVVDPQGKVVEYKAGNYEVRRDEGLKDLEQAIANAASARK